MKQGGVVVVGAGTAGLLAAESARRTSSALDVTLISSETCPPYSPTSLPYLLSRKVGMESVFCRSKEYFASCGIRFVAGRKVVSVDPERKILSFHEGPEMAFESLVIATGARPVKPAIEGIDAGGVFVLRTLADAEAITGYALGKRKMVVLGAGFIGVELALVFAERGMSVTVVERESRVMPMNFDQDASRLIQEKLEGAGVRFCLGTTALQVRKNGSGDAEAVALDGGEVLETDLLIVAAGVAPRIILLRGSGIECRRGILVDDGMRTNFPDVFAAGDVAEARGFFRDQKVINAILPDAAEQGRVAGINAAGGEARYDGSLPMNMFTFLGNTAFSIGDVSAWDDGYETYSRSVDGSYRKLVFDENRLVGAVQVNDDIAAGIVWTLIKSRADLSRVKDELIASAVRPGVLLPAVLTTWI